MTIYRPVARAACAAAAAAQLLFVAACGNNTDPAAGATSVGSTAVEANAPGGRPSTPNGGKHFNRVSTFLVCGQVGGSCESGTETAAEIVAASEDGMTLVYTNSPRQEIGFVDITDPTTPAALGRLAVPGEPTSVTVLGPHALVAVNTSTNFVQVSGLLVVVDIASRTEVARLALPGQPDSVARSKDGRYVAVVIENERDPQVNGGAMPQLPGGSLVIVDAVGAPATWATRTVVLANLAAQLFPTDPEPEFVAINDDNVAVVTLQENNHLVLVDLASGAVTGHFGAGAVTLEKIDTVDERPNQVRFTDTLRNVPREPDGVTWIAADRFVTANEGDLAGGSRGFTVFDTAGNVLYDSGSRMEYEVARAGHANDRRNDAKGNEPENVTFARFGGTDYLFVASERSSVVVVYDMSRPEFPAFKQLLPAAVGPEGVLAIPQRGLLVAASEVDARADLVRSALNIYQYQTARPAYPTLVSVDRDDGTPIPWSALSGLAAARSGQKVYAVDDSFFRGNRIFEIDTAKKPAVVSREIRITDPYRRIAALAAQLPAGPDPNAFDATDLAALVNPDGSVNLDPEGIAVASTGGFWIASEGSGSVGSYEAGRPVRSGNLVLGVSDTGVIERIVRLPDDVNARQARFGFEGIAESDGKLVVAFQRAWVGDPNPRIGIHDLATGTWRFVFYPLDAVASPAGGWVGLSEVTALGADRYLVVERDNAFGPDARIKRLYRIDLNGVANGATIAKTLVRDLLPDLKAPGGSVYEKIEGLAVLVTGEVLIVNDNDGLDSNSGETQLINLGRILK